jgi:predicted histidine transporter YuiF (NhaC family)
MASQWWLAIPALVLISGFVSNILINKIRTYQYQQASNRLQKIEQKEKNQARLIEIKTTKEKLVIIFNTNLLLASLLYKDDPVSNPVNNEANIITKSIITPPY